jgi:hypothetical protein
MMGWTSRWLLPFMSGTGAFPKSDMVFTVAVVAVAVAVVVDADGASRLRVEDSLARLDDYYMI